jgi:hypothetical protein
MQMQRPRPDIPRRNSGPRKKPVKHAIERLGTDRCDAIEGEATAALSDELSSVDL